MRGSVLTRFWAKVDTSGECWLWTAALSHGYPRFGTGGGLVVAGHRFAWELANAEEVPEGLFVLHTCDTPRCVNPSHLYAGTPAQNMQDMVDRNPTHWTSEARMKQCDRLLKILRDGQDHTTREIYRKVGFVHLSDRVSALRRGGYVIVCARRGADHVYRLEGLPSTRGQNTRVEASCAASPGSPVLPAVADQGAAPVAVSLGGDPLMTRAHATAGSTSPQLSLDVAA